jgi:hypothetical protein
MIYHYLFSILGVGALVVFFSWEWLARDTIRVSAQDCLAVLSFDVWKRTRQLRDELERRHKMAVAFADIYTALEELEGRGWVVSRKVANSNLLEFKLTSNGLAERDGMRFAPASSVLTAQLTLGGFL